MCLYDNSDCNVFFYTETLQETPIMLEKPIHTPIFKNRELKKWAEKLKIMKTRISDPIQSFSLVKKKLDHDAYKPLIIDAYDSETIYSLYLYEKDEPDDYIARITITFYSGEYNAYEAILAPFQLFSGPIDSLRRCKHDFSDISLVLHKGYMVSVRGNIVLITETEKDISVLHIHEKTMNMIFNNMT